MPDEVRLTDRSRSAVGFVFGTLGATAVPGPILVQLMAVLGIGEPTTRQLLARMLRQGDVTGERIGRVSVYRLAGLYLERWLRVRHGDTPPVWPGSFQVVVHDLPERHRHQRELLQAAAARAGFGQLRPGVLVGLNPPDFVRHLTDSPRWPREVGVVETGQWVVDLPAARRIASAAWHLATRASDLRQARDGLEELLGEIDVDAGDGVAAFSRLFQATGLAAAPRYNVPVLPDELLPPDWPADQVYRLHRKVIERLRPPTGEYLYLVLADSPHARLIQGGWWPEVRDSVG